MTQSAFPGAASERQTQSTLVKSVLLWVGALLIVAAVFLFGMFKLTDWPATWFDEGSHLHVPKTMVQYGVYADLSSEGFRHYGPTIGVGPTVMLPIAGVFNLFGIGLLQARIVMVLYMFAAVMAFWWLAKTLSSARTAWVATALLVVTPVVGVVEYGRQVLGEVPGLFFVSAGMALWFARWERAKWYELVTTGMLLGLAIVTKYQVLVVLGGGLGLAWLLNFVTFRAPQRLFLIPGAVCLLFFGVWQVFTLVYLGPSTISENLAAFQAAVAGAAAVFNPDLMLRSMRELLKPTAYLSLLLPILAYCGWQLVFAKPGTTFYRSKAQRQQLSIVYLVIVVNLVWYVVASVSWIRYAFVGTAFSALFVGLFFAHLTDDMTWERLGLGKASWLAIGAWALLALLIVQPGAQLARKIVAAPVDTSKAMAAYMDANVPQDALIETWEPQMGFLTDHRYHYPPQSLLNSSVRQEWLGDSEISTLYDFDAMEPPYLLLGEFTRWVRLVPEETLHERFVLEYESGAYALYRRKE